MENDVCQSCIYKDCKQAFPRGMQPQTCSLPMNEMLRPCCCITWPWAENETQDADEAMKRWPQHGGQE